MYTFIRSEMWDMRLPARSSISHLLDVFCEGQISVRTWNAKVFKVRFRIFGWYYRIDGVVDVGIWINGYEYFVRGYLRTKAPVEGVSVAGWFSRARTGQRADIPVRLSKQRQDASKIWIPEWSVQAYFFVRWHSDGVDCTNGWSKLYKRLIFVSASRGSTAHERAVWQEAAFWYHSYGMDGYFPLTKAWSSLWVYSFENSILNT